ncbi:transferase hexapeptide repeat family protein [Marinicella sp. S1101]|uniref:acyltransferase n=1 Tax=Marinicella marina TaxID=2996016 RepID=UPI002260F539|nr:transferase hexapeptide repeat family protein [Marinicella marina]MCX7553480.1 transferase hexapeptide repeat family protein [Marinicella marina]MDJ1140104.1 transferase hexapeptide repeat family protein [Marinicella marina]
MSCYEIDGVKPVIDPSSFIHPTASIIGHVVIGKNCYIGPHASLRGDFGKIVLEDGVNFQDGCIAHGFPEGVTRVRKNGHISHGAVLHGCDIGENCMVGIQTVVMDNAKIGKECMIAALSYIKPNFQAPARSIIAGSPATVKKQVSDEQIKWKTVGTGIYQNLSKRCLETFKPCEPLTDEAEQDDDAKLRVKDFKPLK